MMYTNTYLSNSYVFPAVQPLKILKHPDSTQSFSFDAKISTFKPKKPTPPSQPTKESGKLLSNFGIFAKPKQLQSRVKTTSIRHKIPNRYNHQRSTPSIRLFRL